MALDPRPSPTESSGPQGPRDRRADRSARPPKFRSGDRLRVTHGPFAGHVGLYAGMKPRERVEVLLAILGGSQRVTLAADAVEQAS